MPPGWPGVLSSGELFAFGIGCKGYFWWTEAIGCRSLLRSPWMLLRYFLLSRRPSAQRCAWDCPGLKWKVHVPNLGHTGWPCSLLDDLLWGKPSAIPWGHSVALWSYMPGEGLRPPMSPSLSLDGYNSLQKNIGHGHECCPPSLTPWGWFLIF